jgi:hypothetical protein
MGWAARATGERRGKLVYIPMVLNARTATPHHRGGFLPQSPRRAPVTVGRFSGGSDRYDVEEEENARIEKAKIHPLICLLVSRSPPLSD